MDSKKINPFRHEYFLGYINQVLPQYVKVHFPSSVLLNGFTHYGKEFNGGLVGSFVVIEGSNYGFLGRITELLLPESERLSLSEKAFQTSEFHPSGKIEILLSFDLYDPLTVKKGLTTYPNIGAKVFVSSGDLVQEYMSRFGIKNEENTTAVNLGHLVSSPNIAVKVNLQSIFGRHCAVVGTTGGGKSFTVSKLIEALIKTGNKAILIDATGEYNGKYDGLKNINIGDGESVFHYSQLTIDDLFFMLKPSPRTQTPKLMEAIRSLKIASLCEGENLKFDGKEIPVESGLIKKKGCNKKPYEVFYFRNIGVIENGMADFDFSKLTRQLNEECVWDNGTTWGDISQNDVSYCVSLISRVNNLGNTPELNQVFGFQEEKKENDITDLINNFISVDNKDDKLLRLNLKDVKYDFQVRETLVNAIGKYLLNKARNRDFENSPVVVLVDEAHQFLNKSIKDEYFESKPLDAFDSIAKECRKYGLFLCIATQMPRDIPKGTLSQMGTFIVHRLINFNDKEAISSACSTANKNTLDFLPILGEGEAVVTGVDFPMPIIMKFEKPIEEPNSGTPKLNVLDYYK
ncbi:MULTISPECIES: ATP-binding protein [Arenibacter]|uniref:ATP-binding protein n=1 Tax=Arenibacter TaxID=178469 RepID=UPI0008553EE7|nr:MULTISPECIES: ATP-binding protein [Arenibacter]GBF20692.1 AAA-like domain protein [Arenibacter sp. NBRC 103722]